MLFLVMFIAALAAYFIPVWWMFMPVLFIIAFLSKGTGRRIFWSGFLAMTLCWILLSLFKSLPNNNMLATKVAQLLFMPNWIILLLFTGLIGGILGGLSALSGYSIKGLLKGRITEKTTSVNYL